MTEKVKCESCNGNSIRTVLASQHDDVKETVECTKCNGTGEVNKMTEKEENEYWGPYSIC